jgi:nitrogen regulatory protein P-II 1
VEVVVDDDILERTVDAILNAAYTGRIGDGKIFLYKVESAIRIRSRERGVAAL